jgi:hypothetical protein
MTSATCATVGEAKSAAERATLAFGEDGSKVRIGIERGLYQRELDPLI